MNRSILNKGLYQRGHRKWMERTTLKIEDSLSRLTRPRLGGTRQWKWETWCQMLHWTQQLVEPDDSCLRYEVNICFHCWKASCSYPPFYYMVRLTYEALTVRWVWYTSGLAACQPTAPQASAYLPPNLCQQKRVAWSRGARSRICECVTSSNMLHNKSPGPSKSFTQTQW